jgi:O-methyltransferase
MTSTPRPSPPSKWAPAVKTTLLHKIGLSKRPYELKCEYKGDGFGTRGKSLKFMEDPAFVRAWEETAATFRAATGEESPDIRWRSHIAVWAAKRGLALEGDFADCGVFTGALAQMVCRLTDFAKSGRNYWLFDTWAGVPVEGLAGGDLEMANYQNATTYHRFDSIYSEAQKIFAAWPGCRLVRGVLPQSLGQADIRKLAYLSVDLNNSPAEKGVIEALWDKMVPGAICLIDDYNWTAHRDQQDMWDAFAESKGQMIAALPTGQGILIKP